TTYGAFDPLSVKLAEVGVKDNQGRVVPLSERFNDQTPDIRYSVRKGADDLAPRPQVHPSSRQAIATAAMDIAAKGGVKEIVRPDLSTLDQTPAGQKVLNEVNAARKQAGLPKHRSIAAADALAERQLANDPSISKAILAGRYATRTPEDNRMVFQVMNAAVNSKDPAMRAKGYLVAAMAREQGSEQARILGSRRSIGMYDSAAPEDWAVLSLTPPLSEEQLRTLKEGTEEERMELGKKLAEQADEIKARVAAKFGMDMDEIKGKDLYDPSISAPLFAALESVRADMVREGKIEAVEARFHDKLLDYFINNIMSSLEVPTTDMLGSGVTALLDTVLAKPLSIAIDAARGKTDRATMQDWAYGMKAAAKDFVTPWRLAALSWRYRMSGVEIVAKGKAVSEHRLGFQSKVPLPKIFTLSARNSLFAENLIGGYAFGMLNALEARRQARQELGPGATDAQLERRTEEIRKDPQSGARARAFEETWHALAKAEYGEIGLAFERVFDRIWPVKFLIPIRRTAVNLLKLSGRLSPIAIGRVLYKVSPRNKNRAAYLASEEASRDMAYTALGTLIAGLVLKYALNDDDDPPLITGSIAPHGTQPYTLYIPGTKYYVSYQALDPVSTVVGATVDAARLAKRGDWTMIPAAMTNQLTSKTYLKTLGEAWNAVAGGFKMYGSGASAKTSVTKPMLRLVGGVLAGFVPYSGAWRAVVRESRGEKMSTGYKGGGDDSGRLIAREFERQAESFGFGDPTPVVDSWGRHVKNLPQGETIPGRILTTAGRLTVRLNPQRLDDTLNEFDRMILRYNALNPDTPYRLETPSKWYKNSKDGKTREIDDVQYTQYTERAGEILAARVKSYGSLFDLKNPTDKQIAIFDKLVLLSRARARREVLGPKYAWAKE
ncbi:MAG: hypothetical protein WCX95_05315, partial [Candidatus Gracilibacteria bacterium]